MDPRLDDLFRDKPEMLINLPAWMLPAAEVERLRDAPGLALVELAGRDSVAAALKAVTERGLGTLVPTYVYTGSEYGAWSAVAQARRRLRSRLPAGVEVTPTLVLGSPRFWRALNGRFLQELAARFGFTPVCPGCHLYLHAARLPLARLLGGAPVIAGERLSHDGRQKLNQVATAQDAYLRLYAEFGAELLLPLHEISSGQEIEDILGLDWAQGGDQLGCVFSGNYLNRHGGLEVDQDALAAYFHHFALPLVRRVLRSYLEGRVPDHQALAKQVLAG